LNETTATQNRLPEKYKAFLSDYTSSPVTSFSNPSVPYQLMDANHSTVAGNWHNWLQCLWFRQSPSA